VRTLAALLLLGFALALPAMAGLSPAALNTVGVDVGRDARVPLTLRFTDDSGTPRTLADAMGGTPAVLVFADYTCTNLCGPIVAFAAGGLAKSGLVAGKDFHLVVIGLDPKDGPKEARAMAASHIGTDGPLRAATALLFGTQVAIDAATQAAGYHYVYDREHDQFAHPAAAYVLAKDGRIARVLSGLGLSGHDLRLALVDAGQGHIGTLLDQITLRCFGFDPTRGVYTATISRWLTIAGVATVLAVAGGLAFMALRPQRRPLT
jgi:protein SCO1/2